MGIKFKKIMAVALAAALTFSVAPVMPTEAAEVAQHQTWVNQGNGWHYLQGTDVKVQIANDIIHFTGTGEIPDFDYWYMYERPWATSNCHYVMIDDTITSIGKYAFYEMKNIKHIIMSTKTFIEDTTVFQGIAYKPVFRITGKETTTKMYGTIPYTSLESIEAFAQVNSMGASYILDDQKMATEFQCSVNPSICNVFVSTDEKAPWQNVDLSGNSNGNVMTPIVKLSAETPDYTLKLSAQRRFPGKACYEAYAAFIGDYTLATTYNIVVEKEGKKLTTTTNTLKYIITIPQKYRQVGRSFRLLAIGQGVVDIYDDLDTSDETITFATDKPTTAYALVYK